MSDPFDHVSDLLSVLADPKKAAAALKEQRDLLEKNTRIGEAIKRSQIAAEQALDQAHAAQENAKNIMASVEAKERGLDARKMQVAELERALTERQRNFLMAQDAHTEGVARKESELLAREQAVAKAESERAALAEDRRLLDEQMAKARAFLRV